MTTYSVRVADDPKGGYRLMVKSLGWETPAGTRLQRGKPGAGNLFEGPHKGEDKEALEKIGRDLEKYLNEFEEKRTKKKKR